MSTDAVNRSAKTTPATPAARGVVSCCGAETRASRVRSTVARPAEPPPRSISPPSTAELVRLARNLRVVSPYTSRAASSAERVRGARSCAITGRTRTRQARPTQPASLDRGRIEQREDEDGRGGAVGPTDSQQQRVRDVHPRTHRPVARNHGSASAVAGRGDPAAAHHLRQRHLRHLPRRLLPPAQVLEVRTRVLHR